LFQSFEPSSFAELPQLPIEVDAYDRSDANGECENNSPIQRGSEYSPDKVIGDKKL
jgi:hypothetical protein